MSPPSLAHCLNINNDATCLGVSTVCVLPRSIESLSFSTQTHIDTYRPCRRIGLLRLRIRCCLPQIVIKFNWCATPCPLPRTRSVCPTQRKARKNYANLCVVLSLLQSAPFFVSLCLPHPTSAHFHYRFQFQFQLVDQLVVVRAT